MTELGKPLREFGGIRIRRVQDVHPEKIEEAASLGHFFDRYNKSEHEIQEVTDFIRKEMQQVHRNPITSRNTAVVAEEVATGHVVGVAFGKPVVDALEPKNPIYRAVCRNGSEFRTLFLFFQVVHPEWRRKGIGKALIEVRRELGKELRCNQVLHVVLPENAERKPLIPKTAKFLGMFDFGGAAHEVHLEQMETVPVRKPKLR